MHFSKLMPQHRSSHSSLTSRLELLHVTVFTPKYTSPALVYCSHFTCKQSIVHVRSILLSERCNHVFPEHSYSVHVYYDFSWKCIVIERFLFQKGTHSIPLTTTVHCTCTYTALACEICKFKRFPSLLCFSCSSSAFLF